MRGGLPQLVAVIGAGQMGCGIAELFAWKGFPTILLDKTESILKQAQARIERSLSAADGLTDDEKKESFARIQTVGSFEKLHAADLIVEAVTENEAIKKEVLAECAENVQPGALISSNTSSISITRLASVLKSSEQAASFIGLHFMKPAPKMQLIEIVRGMKTSDECYERAKQTSKALGKIVCTSADRPGFIVNRILMPMINEAFFALMEQVATAEEIDIGMKYGTNQPMGPLTLADFIGLDVCLSIMTVMHQSLGEDKYRPCPLLRQYVDAGSYGKKTGKGVFDYRL